MPPEAGSPEEWLEHAREDLAMAQAPLPDGAKYRLLCFPAQQAAEKATKAVLISEGVEFPRTHDIAALASLLPTDLHLPAEVRLSATLTPYALFLRYPGDHPSVTEANHREAVRLAEAVVTWAEGIIGERRTREGDEPPEETEDGTESGTP